MSSISSILPTPKQNYKLEEHSLFLNNNKSSSPSSSSSSSTSTLTSSNIQIPKYGKRKGYQPKSIGDFGDGGSFPEIHMVQYPLNMGRKKSVTTTNGTLLHDAKGAVGSTSKDIVALQVDSNGRVKYENVLGIDKNKAVYSQYTDLIPKQFGESELERPDEESVAETTSRTKEALEKLVNTKIASSQPLNKGFVDKQGSVSYVKYTPSQQNSQHNSGSQSRVIRMVDVAQDPMEPSKYRLKKDVRRPPSPPAPIMHSPERKASAAEIDEWKVPPCISNWQNNAGFVVALDKRLNADGRSLQRPEINDKFAHLSQALYIAETNSRDEVTARAELEKKLAQKEKDRKQDMLRKMAEDVRNERSGFIKLNNEQEEKEKEEKEIELKRQENRRDNNNNNLRRDDRDYDDRHDRRDYRNNDNRHDRRDRDYDRRDDRRDERSSRSSQSFDDEEKERDKIREEKKREREREYRLEASGKKSKMNRDQERDISEKIALGQVTGVRTEDSIFDQRLFNQSDGLSSGFNGGDDESYNVYDKPLFTDRVASSIYRPRGGSSIDGDGEQSIEDALKTSRFKPHKEFSGSDHSKVRSGPVMFEQERKSSTKQTSQDPFGMDEFLSQVKNKSNNSNNNNNNDHKRK